MINLMQLDTQTQSTSPSAISLENLSAEGTLKEGFSSVFKGVVLQQQLLQNGTQALSELQNATDEQDAKTALKSSLLGLLTQDSQEDTTDMLTLNPEVTQGMSPKELKALIQEAKSFLKNKIADLDGFKKSEIEKLPKTLKGLMQAAKKFGIDVSKISLEEVRPQEDSSLELISTKDKKIKSSKETHIVSTAKVKVPKVANQESASAEDALDMEMKREQKAVKNSANTTALFVSTDKTKLPQLSTELFVHTKIQQKNTTKETTKEKQNNTLELLLRGKSLAKQEQTTGANFSVETARVIPSLAKTDSVKNLESLLHGQSEENTQNSNATSTQQSVQLKADSFEVKLHEAKQMMKYLSQDVKQAIDDYKAPFTRVKVQLNPQKLGEIDLTVIQRGKNLHINLSSNNNAVSTLALHVNDLKMQLQNSGIQNATLNFSNTSGGEQSGAGGSMPQQQQNNRRDAQEEYSYFETEQLQEEQQSSLEIVVPYYA